MLPTPTELSNRIRRFADEQYSGFTGWPKTHLEAIEKWSDIFSFTLDNVIPITTTRSPAKIAFESQLQGLTYNSPGLQMIVNGFQQGATIIATGMTGAGFTGVTPPLPIVFNPTGLITKNAKTEIDKIADAIIVWAKTGTAIPTAGGPITNWN